jgi:LPS sulfotransferase NodH
MSATKELFINPILDLERLQVIEAMQEPRSRYVIAITPRSGSTYLCDVMRQTKRFGNPQEILDPKPIALRLPTMPARSPEQYLRNVLRVQQSANGVSGFKASWFQWQNFQASTDNHEIFSKLKYIYLTRRNLALQAVSLYKATQSSVFHAPANNNEQALIKLQQLEYDYEKIKFWHEHITAQEQGWQNYFYQHNIFPLCLSYEEIENNIEQVLKRIASYVGVNTNNVAVPQKASAYTKISDARNNEWALRFYIENSRLLIEEANHAT